MPQVSYEDIGGLRDEMQRSGHDRITPQAPGIFEKLD